MTTTIQQRNAKADYLHEIDIFQDLTPEEVKEIARMTKMSEYRPGHIFYMPEDPGDVLFLLKRGNVQLYRVSPDGRKLVVSALSAGAVFGQMSLVGQRMHETFAEAADNCLICTMGREEVEQILLKKPQVALRIMDAIGRRLFDAERRLEEVTFKRVPARLASLIVRLNAEQGNNSVLKGYTHQYLADMLGTYRETTTQALNEFKSQGLIRIGRKTIEILDEEGLRNIASD